MAQKRYVVEVEKAKEATAGKPSLGPVYRNVVAKDGFRQLPPGIESCWDIFRLSVQKHPKNLMLGEREMVNGKAGRFVWLSYEDAYNIVLKVGASIRATGVAQGARCGIYGANCAKWVLTMQACNAYGFHCVPLYDSLGAGAVEYIINHAEVCIAFAAESKLSEVLKTLPSTGKYLKTLVSFGSVTAEQKKAAGNLGVALYSWDHFLQLGKDMCYDLPEKKKADTCTIMYTSGTTGEPKGVLLSNESILSVISGVVHSLESMNREFIEEDVYLSYLPLAHIFDRVIEELIISTGAAIGYWQGDVKLLMEDMKELRPTVFCSVPRVLDRIYAGLIEKISSTSLIKRAVFNLAYSYKLSNMNRGYKQVEAAPVFDKIVFSKVKEGLGGNVRLILSGAAPLASHIETYLRVVCCADVVQGYGLTETCAGSFVALPDDMGMVGTVGPPLPNVDVRLESVPEMGYDALSSTPRGEICVRGKALFSGYYKREDLTREVMGDDGWFHTGDIGEWLPDGSMKIIDRKKNIFKLSQGEYVSVENLENIYSLAPCVDSIWVYGNSFESFLVAVVNPNRESLECWAEQNGVLGDFEAICDSPQARARVLEELTKMGREYKLKGFEFVKAVHLDPVPFDMDRNLITPTFKKKRAQFLEYYQIVVNGMYKSKKEAM